VRSFRPLLTEVKRLKEQAKTALPQAKPDILRRLEADPTLAMTAAGLTPDPWQRELIRSTARQIAVLCTRRAGKSQGVAGKVLARCLTKPREYVLVFSPTEDQSKEFLSLVREGNEALGCPVPLIRESLTELAWANGSRIKAKADSPRGSRGATPTVVVIDEGAQASDELYLSLRPMMILGKVEMIILSTPFGKLGWFFDIWDKPAKLAAWKTFLVTADECPRIDRAILEEHRQTMPTNWFMQEYYCQFNDAVDAVFSKVVIDRAERADELYLPISL